MFMRSPASVVSPPGTRTSRMSRAVTCTSSRRRSTWCARGPRIWLNTSAATGTRSGWATQVPSKPSVASRTLSSFTFASAISFDGGIPAAGMNAAMPPIACAPRRWQV